VAEVFVETRAGAGWSASSALHRWHRRQSVWFFAPHAAQTRG
jgi:hypothetical protein